MELNETKLSFDKISDFKIKFNNHEISFSLIYL